MDGIDVYYTIQSKLFEQGLLDKEINQLLLEFSLMNLTPKEHKLFILENDHTNDVIKEWLHWKDIHRQKAKAFPYLWRAFSTLLKLGHTVDEHETMLTWLAIEIKKSELSNDDDKAGHLQEIRQFLCSAKQLHKLEMERRKTAVK